jgi:hypothetical protein
MIVGTRYPNLGCAIADVCEEAMAAMRARRSMFLLERVFTPITRPDQNRYIFQRGIGDSYEALSERRLP